MSKIICLCCFRDAAAYLPEFVRHLNPYVDGFIFMDDRSASRDAATELKLMEVYQGAKPVNLIRREPKPNLEPFAFESRNRQILLREAWAEGATHILALDGDERMEIGFLRDLRNLCDSEIVAASVHVRDLWNDHGQYRIDNPWGLKRKMVLFNLAKCQFYQTGPGLHHPWITVDEHEISHTEFNLYHYGSLTPELRAGRVRRHEAADVERKWQADYSYLAKEGPELQLERIPEGRNWY